MTITAVLFDLDGTLLDTAHDLSEAMNLTLTAYGRPVIDPHHFRQSIAYGTHVMLTTAFKIDSSDRLFNAIKEQFLQNYEQCLGKYTTLFDGMDHVLDHLDSHNIPWGIVTSKLRRFTMPLLQKLHLEQRAVCIVTGDTLAYIKPHPEPLLHGCRLLNSNPHETLYVGDYSVDVQASTAAQMPHIIITNYYHRPDEDPYSWNADCVIEKAEQLLQFL